MVNSSPSIRDRDKTDLPYPGPAETQRVDNLLSRHLRRIYPDPLSRILLPKIILHESGANYDIAKHNGFLVVFLGHSTTDTNNQSKLDIPEAESECSRRRRCCSLTVTNRRLAASDCQEGNRRDCNMSGNQTSDKEGGVQCVMMFVCMYA